MAKTVEIQGLDKLISKISKMPQKLIDEVDEIIADEIGVMETSAKRNAPKNVGFLVNGIGTRRNGEMDYDYFSAADYSVYVEFGTRLHALPIPAELQKFANNTAKNSGKAKQMIYEWCRQKGIDPKLWWPIYVKLMTEGMEPHPFFFEPFYVGRAKIINMVKKAITDLK